MTTITPEAYVDALAIMADAPQSSLPMSVQEMHLYSYLGCIFALFKGKPIAEWGYPYALTTEGFPFSAQFDAAREMLCSNGLIIVDGEGLMRPRQPDLSDEFETMLAIGSGKERRVWLRAATDCALALPMGSIRHAINRSPGVAQSFMLGQRGLLLEPDDVSLLYQEYGVVSSVLGENAQDVLSPAVIWLSARILRKGESVV